MTVKIACPNCDVKLKIDESLIGAALRCPKCKVSFKSTPVERAPVEVAPPEVPKPAAPHDDIDFENWNLSDDISSGGVDIDDLPPLPTPKRKAKKPPNPAQVDKRPKPQPVPDKVRAQNPFQSIAVIATVGGIAAISVGLLVGYVFFPAKGSKDSSVAKSTKDPSSQKAVAENSPQESHSGTSENAASSTPKVTIAETKEGNDVKSCVQSITRLLTEGNDQEFFINFAPLEELRKFQESKQNGSRPPEIPRESLQSVIRLVGKENPELDATGLTAVFQVRSEQKFDPEWSPGAGYSGDVSAVIKASISDINENRIKQFIRNTFPPSALRAMFRNGVDHAAGAFVDKDSGIVQLMLQDLILLQSLKPNVKNNVAEFQLPPVEYSQKQVTAIRPAGDRYQIPERVIRFSLINGKWRFYDDGSLERSGALNPKGATLKFERAGTAWRLARYP